MIIVKVGRIIKILRVKRCIELMILGDFGILLKFRYLINNFKSFF